MPTERADRPVHALTDEDLRDRAAITDVIVRYAESLDAGDIEGVVSCFVEDALLSYRDGEIVLHGREQLRALLTRGGSDIRLSPMSPTAATTHCMTIVICRRRKASRRMEKEPHASM